LTVINVTLRISSGVASKDEPNKLESGLAAYATEVKTYSPSVHQLPVRNISPCILQNVYMSLKNLQNFLRNMKVLHAYYYQ